MTRLLPQAKPRSALVLQPTAQAAGYKFIPAGIFGTHARTCHRSLLDRLLQSFTQSRMRSSLDLSPHPYRPVPHSTRNYSVSLPRSSLRTYSQSCRRRFAVSSPYSLLLRRRRDSPGSAGRGWLSRTALVVRSGPGEQCLVALAFGVAHCAGYEILCASMGNFAGGKKEVARPSGPGPRPCTSPRRWPPPASRGPPRWPRRSSR